VKELAILSKSWAEWGANIAFWREHAGGVHFAMYKKQKGLVDYLVQLVEMCGRIDLQVAH
jgi:hypothetical protein